MRIVSLDLENIKSYARLTVELTDGLNAICGHNGSGKTTILEAIGWALFDFLPYNQNAFVREGEKAGSVRVRIIARDGREYEIVRRVGKPGAYYVSDVESGLRLAERGPDVLEWIRSRALGMDSGVELSTLFKNAVGVPQGLITSDFLQSSGTARKGVFDPLLRVEEYRKAYEELAKTNSYLAGLGNEVRVEIARLEEETRDVPERRAAIASMEATVSDIERNLQRLASELADLEVQKDGLDALQEQQRMRQTEFSNAQYDVRRATDLLTLRMGELDRAAAARASAAESEPGFRVVVDARAQLRELEAQRVERDRLREQSNRAIVALSTVNSRIETLRDQWNGAKQAALDAAALARLADEQIDLEARLQAVNARLHVVDDVRSQIEQRRTDFVQVVAAVSERARRIQNAENAEREAESLSQRQAALDEVTAALARLEPLKVRSVEIHDLGTQLRKQHDDLQQRMQERDVLVARQPELEQQCVELSALVDREQSLRDAQVRADATIEYQSVARRELEDAHCPLLAIACPAVQASVAVLDRFDNQAVVLRDRSAVLAEELRALRESLRVAREAEKHLDQLRVEVARFHDVDTRFTEIEAELKQCREQYAVLQKQVKDEPELLSARDRLTAEVEVLRGKARDAALLPELRQMQERDDVRRSELQASVAALETRMAELDGVSMQRDQLQARIDALGDPRGRQARLHAVAEREAELRAQLDQCQGELTQTQHRLQAITAQMQQYETLEASIEEQRRLESEYEPAHNRYLQFRDEAETLEQRRLVVVEAEAQRVRAEENERRLGALLAETEARYDRDRHAAVRARHAAIREDASARSRERDLVNARLVEQRAELQRRERRLRSLDDKRAELDDLGQIVTAVSFIRDTIKAAGPAITETLLANISQTANDIYAEIMDDHAADLRWTRDYEIIVQRGVEDRHFTQLSGGEQMSAALAVRLALLKEMSDINFAFFDEPTQNMDADRRDNLAFQIQAVRGFEQLIVISHDDTFEQHTDNLIRLQKVHEETELIAG